jgi:hypothetical protein
MIANEPEQNWHQCQKDAGRKMGNGTGSGLTFGTAEKNKFFLRVFSCFACLPRKKACF